MTDIRADSFDPLLPRLIHLSERKRRLLHVAIGRLLQGAIVDSRCQEALTNCLSVLERYVDGRATHRDVTMFRTPLELFVDSSLPTADVYAFAHRSLASHLDLLDTQRAVTTVKRWLTPPRAHRELSVILDDLVGGSTRAGATVPGRWLTADVLGLARTIYEHNRHDLLPIVADALIDAGCTDAKLLRHCSEPLTHYRGCWVVDALLGLA